MIAHHPRIAWLRSERFERVTIDARIRLAAAELALDHHDVEEAREVPAHDLLALHAGITLGDGPERETSRPQALERGEGVGEERPRGTSAVGEVGRHPRGQAVAEPAAAIERTLHDLAPRAHHVGTLQPVALGIAPEQCPHVADGRRSEERRVGKECRSRGGTYHWKRKGMVE